MKLVIMVVDGADADRLSDELVHRGHAVTRLGSSGGFLRRRSATLISGVDDGAVDAVIEIARRLTEAREEFTPLRQLPFLGELDVTHAAQTVRRGGAVIWVVPVERFERI